MPKCAVTEPMRAQPLPLRGQGEVQPRRTATRGPTLWTKRREETFDAEVVSSVKWVCCDRPAWWRE